MKDRETYNETRAISNYEKMLLWAIENDVKKEDFVVAGKIFFSGVWGPKVVELLGLIHKIL